MPRVARQDRAGSKHLEAPQEWLPPQRRLYEDHVAAPAQSVPRPDHRDVPGLDEASEQDRVERFRGALDRDPKRLAAEPLDALLATERVRGALGPQRQPVRPPPHELVAGPEPANEHDANHDGEGQAGRIRHTVRIASRPLAREPHRSARSL
ncbi:MAG TPA: hypothetical protein VFG86_25005 [Chloroflexota bacterium]|nr:hypothetical protein [Chloroflexota bacterium]